MIDFGVIKTIFGEWVDKFLDHGTLVNDKDQSLIALCMREGWRYFTMQGNPTAENIAAMLFAKGQELLEAHGVDVVHVRVYETPNCWADYP